MNRKNLLWIAIIFALGLTRLGAEPLKGDPWIFQAYKELFNRQPDAWELNIHNYNSGSWKNYAELKGFVQQYHTSMTSFVLSVNIVAASTGKLVVLFNQKGKSIAADLIANDGGSIVAAGGGNIVAAGGGNIVAAGGGNIVAAGGGNFKDLKGVAFGSRYQVQAVGTTIVPASGNGALIIR